MSEPMSDGRLKSIEEASLICGGWVRIDIDALIVEVRRLRRAVEAARAEQREADAKVAETFDPHTGNPGYDHAMTASIAAAIRSAGEKV